MANFDLTSLFEKLSGKLNRKDKVIYRKTRRYDSRGRIVLEGKHAYTVVDKRDFKRKPPRGAEKQNMEIMAEAQRLTHRLLTSDTSDLTQLMERFERQLATGKPDPEVPVLKKTGKQNVYAQFDRFVYALIYNRLRQQTNNNIPTTNETRNGLTLPLVLFLCAIVLLSSCGAKKGYLVGDFGKQPLCGKVIANTASADSSLVERETLGLWWQKDTLQLTLNQGRQLLAARAKGDTLYLHETSRDTADVNTRQYVINIPQKECLIIKYNDTLVYPLIPAAKSCEYPMDIKSMNVGNIKKYNDLIRRTDEQQKQTGLWGGMYILSYEPLELRAGTYLFNAGSYIYGSDCECKIDSAKVLILNIDGTWEQYECGKIENCGIMRKFWLPITYEAFCYKDKIVYFSDTTSIHFLDMEEWKRRKTEQITVKPNEYRCIGTASPSGCALFTIFSCIEDSLMHHLFDGYSSTQHDGPVLMYEGTTCGWKKISDNQ